MGNTVPFCPLNAQKNRKSNVYNFLKNENFIFYKEDHVIESKALENQRMAVLERLFCQLIKEKNLVSQPIKMNIVSVIDRLTNSKAIFFYIS